MSESPEFSFAVPASGRLDEALRNGLQLSVLAVKRLVKAGGVLVNGKRISKPAFAVFPGDVLSGTKPVAVTITREAKPRLEIVVIYEDRHLLAIAKPGGWLSVPTSYSKEKSSQDRAEEFLRQKSPQAKAYAVHRLDRGASGVLIFARDFATREAMMDAFKNKLVEKTYLALISSQAKPFPEKGEINLPIDDSKKYGAVVVGQGKDSRTLYRVIQRNDSHALIHAQTKTGRRHQVRAHLAASLGPIVGDEIYGTGPDQALFLHAAEVRFIHPISKQRIEIKAPLPVAWQAMLAEVFNCPVSELRLS